MHNIRAVWALKTLQSLLALLKSVLRTLSAAALANNDGGGCPAPLPLPGQERTQGVLAVSRHHDVWPARGIIATQQQ